MIDGQSDPHRPAALSGTGWDGLWGTRCGGVAASASGARRATRLLADTAASAFYAPGITRTTSLAFYGLTR